MLRSAIAGLKGIVINLVLLAALLTMLFAPSAGVPPAMAASSWYIENFTTTTYRDPGATNATGWGAGALFLPTIAPTLVANYDVPGQAVHLSVAGDLVYLSLAGVYLYKSRLLVVNITNPTRPTLVGTCYTPAGRFRDLSVAGDYAYILADQAGLCVINITDPANPLLVGTCAVRGGVGLNVFVVGNLAYIASWGGLQVVNVSAPGNPTPLGGCASAGIGDHVCVAGDLAYVACSQGLQVVNVTVPSQPIVLGCASLPTTVTGCAVDVVGDHAYVARGDGRMQVVDVSVPRRPTVVGTCITGRAEDINLVGDYAYVACRGDGIYVVNVTSPNHPTVVGNFHTRYSAAEVVVTGECACVADDALGLSIFKVADFAEPSLVGAWNFPCSEAAVVGNLVYGVGGSAFQIANVTDLTHPILVGSCVIASDPQAVFVAGDFAYIADYSAGLQVVDIADARYPMLVGSSAIPGCARHVVVDGDFAYVVAESAGMLAVNVTEPRNPALAGSCAIPGDPNHLVVDGGFAYVAAGSAGVQVINITDPLHPSIIGAWGSPAAAACGVFVAGDLAYVAHNASGLQVIGVSDPRHPALVGTCDTPGMARQVIVSGNIAYVADSLSGLQLINVTDPANPAIVGTYATAGPAVGVIVDGDYAYVQDSAGVRIVEVQRSRCRVFHTRAMVQSLALPGRSSHLSVVRAIVTSVQTLSPDISVTHYLSPDNGNHWEPVTIGVEHVFAYGGSRLLWRAVLATTNSRCTPILTSLAIQYETRLDAPSLVSPAIGSTTTERPLFEWTVIPWAKSYLLQLDTMSDFSSLNLHNITIPDRTIYSPSSALAVGTWYWRVAAIDYGGDLGAFSPTFTFVVQPPVVPIFVWQAILVASVASVFAGVVGLSLYRRRKAASPALSPDRRRHATED